MASLYLLNLEGCPAADQVEKTAKLWVRLIWDDHRVSWHQQADDARIRATFASIAANVTRWPAPAKFWEHLKERPRPPASSTLMHPRAGRENEPEVLANMVKQFAEFGRDRWGNVVEPQA